MGFLCKKLSQGFDMILLYNIHTGISYTDILSLCYKGLEKHIYRGLVVIPNMKRNEMMVTILRSRSNSPKDY